MDKAPLAATVTPRERVRAILTYMDRYDNTTQYQWFLEIARAFLSFQGDRISVKDADWLCDQADRPWPSPTGSSRYCGRPTCSRSS
jgi:glucuronate isomerase